MASPKNSKRPWGLAPATARRWSTSRSGTTGAVRNPPKPTGKCTTPTPTRTGGAGRRPGRWSSVGVGEQLFEALCDEGGRARPRSAGAVVTAWSGMAHILPRAAIVDGPAGGGAAQLPALSSVDEAADERAEELRSAEPMNRPRVPAGRRRSDRGSTSRTRRGSPDGGSPTTRNPPPSRTASTTGPKFARYATAKWAAW